MNDSFQNFSISAFRQRFLCDYVDEKGIVTIKEAASLCGVSEATVRRDLDDMAEKSMLVRTRGGAVKFSSTGFEQILDVRMKVMITEKRRIAAFAAKMVKEGESVILDSGTTTYFIAKELSKRENITIITNNIAIAYRVPMSPLSSVIVAGGIRREEQNTLIGISTEEFFRSVNADIAFIGCDSVDLAAGSIYNASFMEVGVKKQMIKSANSIYLVADHAKFSRKSLALVASLDEFDGVITDEGLDEESRGILQDRGLNILIA